MNTPAVIVGIIGLIFLGLAFYFSRKSEFRITPSKEDD